MTRKSYGYQIEELVTQQYLQQGWTILATNYTIRGGEIDLIVEDRGKRRYIEIKGVDHIEDLQGYITPRKLYALYRAIATYERTSPSPTSYQIDVVFVRKGRIIEICENVTI